MLVPALTGLLGIDPGAHVGVAKAGGSSQVKPMKVQGRGGGEALGQAGRLQQHRHPAGVVVGAGGAGHRVEMRPQDIVAAGGRLSGHDIAHFLAHIGVALPPGFIAQPGEALEDIIFGGLKILGKIDGALPQLDAEVFQVGSQIAPNLGAVHDFSRPQAGAPNAGEPPAPN